MRLREQREGERFWIVAAAMCAIIVLGVYAATSGPRSPALDRILQENCPNWVC